MFGVVGLIPKCLRRSVESGGGYRVDYYNRQRPHAFNDGIPPVAAEENLKILSGIS